MENVNELKKGNYVVHEGKIMIVGEVFETPKANYDQSGIGVHLLHLNGNPYDVSAGRSPKDFSVLSINEVHLLSAGFIKFTPTAFFLNGVTVVFDGEVPHIAYGNKLINDIYGFHNLQNIYLEHTGSELLLTSHLN